MAPLTFSFALPPQGGVEGAGGADFHFPPPRKPVVLLARDGPGFGSNIVSVVYYALPFLLVLFFYDYLSYRGKVYACVFPVHLISRCS